MTLKQIVSKYDVSVCTVLKWKVRTDVNDKKRVRRTKFKIKHVKFIKKLAEGMFTGMIKLAQE